MVIWELRFTDGRGSSVYTTTDVTSDLGKAGHVRTFEIAAALGKESPLHDAHRCLSNGRTVYLTAQMGAIAYAVRHVVED